MTELLAIPTPPSARRAQTRERLMTAAASVFAARGIFGASVEEICEAAGFTRGAFYSNFADKDELVLALLRREAESQYSAAERAIAAMKHGARKDSAQKAATPEQHTSQQSAAEDLLRLALTTFEQGQLGRDWVLTQQELLLYAARVDRVRESYREFSAESRRQFSSLIGDAIGYAGLEFTVSFADAIAVLGATHQQIQLDSLISGGPLDFRPLGVVLLAISQPAPAAVEAVPGSQGDGLAP
jgi:AcrR family transcriptional regulator